MSFFRCKRYEYDFSKPKIWQFFETFYDETNHRSTLPRRGRSRRRGNASMSIFQKLMLDLFLVVVDPSK